MAKILLYKKLTDSKSSLFRLVQALYSDSSLNKRQVMLVSMFIDDGPMEGVLDPKILSGCSSSHREQ